MPLQKNLNELIRGKIRYDEPLREHTTFKIGGPAQIWAEPQDLEDLRRLIIFSKEANLKTFILGAGSNVLFKDTPYDGIVISLCEPYFKKAHMANGYAEVGAGVYLGSLINWAKESGLGGLEPLAGIPATLGGALVMNAGGLGDIVEEVTVLDGEGNEMRLAKNEINFGYRNSSLDNFIVLAAKLKLVKRGRDEIERLRAHYLEKKRESQDLSSPSAGCVFKNPKDGLSAGNLIESCGLKGLRVGGAEVSGIHANFIINKGSATCKDVLALINCITYEVERKCGIALELEVRVV